MSKPGRGCDVGITGITSDKEMRSGTLDEGTVASDTGARERERVPRAIPARRSIKPLRVLEGSEARPAALGSVWAVCPLAWCCFLRQPLVNFRSSPVRRCEKGRLVQLLVGSMGEDAAGTVDIRNQTPKILQM